MKKFPVIFLLIISLASHTALSQAAKEPSTKIESLLSKSGKVFVRDFYEIGTIMGKNGSSIEFSALVVYEAGNEAGRLRGIKIEIIGNGNEKRSGSALLDYDEVESFGQAIVNFMQTTSSWKFTNKDSSQMVYSTKDGFKFGFFQSGTEQTGFSEYGCTDKVSCFFDIEVLNTVKLIVDKAKAILSQK